MKEAMFEKFKIRRSASSDVDVFPQRNQITLGGQPRKTDMSKKSESKVTIVKSFCLANSHIPESVQLSNPTELTCRQSEKLSGNNCRIRYEIFWSNSNFISHILQNTLPFRGKRKASQNVLLGQFGKIRKNFIVGHSRRQPFQNIINGNTSISYTRLPKTFFGIDANNVVKGVHSDDN